MHRTHVLVNDEIFQLHHIDIFNSWHLNNLTLNCICNLIRRGEGGVYVAWRAHGATWQVQTESKHTPFLGGLWELTRRRTNERDHPGKFAGGPTKRTHDARRKERAQNQNRNHTLILDGSDAVAASYPSEL